MTVKKEDKRPGKDIFNSNRYEGFVPEKRAILLFASESDCNIFLNWWCLGGELPKAREEVMRGPVTAKAPLSSDKLKPKPQCPKCYADNIGIRCRACGWIGDEEQLITDKTKCKCCGRDEKRFGSTLTIHGHICGYCLTNCYVGGPCTRKACGISLTAAERKRPSGAIEYDPTKGNEEVVE